MWFHLEPRGAGYSGALSGVAVSKNVAGPYSFVNAFRPNAGFWPVNVQELHKQPCTLSADLRFSGGELPAHPDSLNLLGRDQISGQMARDMNLFVDDDGIAYHIYSSEENSTLHISQLTDDYTSYSGKYARFFPGRFMEAPALFKQKGQYYLIMSGCTGWARMRDDRRSLPRFGDLGRNWKIRLGRELGGVVLFSEHVRIACTRPCGSLYLYGRSLDSGERYRRTLYLASYPIRGGATRDRVAI